MSDLTYEGEKIQSAGDYVTGRIPKVAVTDAVGTPMILDKSGAMPMVTEFQAAIHDGESFSYTGNEIGLGIGADVMFLGRTGAKQVHFDGFYVKTSQAPFRVDFYEAPTVTTPGTLLESRRRNRSNTTVSLMQIYSGPTVSADGIMLSDDLLVEASQGASKNTGSGGVDDGWVLKANTDYLIRMTNLSGVAVDWSAKFTWHEATYNV